MMKQITFAALIGALTCATAWAIPEADYFRTFQAAVLPFYETQGATGSLVGRGGVRISYRKFEVADEKGAIVFSPGRAENYLKYAELEFDLVRAGYSLYVIDHRGQGYSQRLARHPRVGHIEDFGHYVEDLKAFVDQVVNTVPHKRRFLLTNSMGGAIGAMYLARYANDFDRAVMSVPMMEIDTGKYPEPVAYGIAALQSLVGHGGEFALGQSDYDFAPRTDCISTEDGRIRRACAYEEIIRANPEVAIGGASYGWVLESLKATRKIRAGLGREVRTPLLIFQAGLDELVRPGGQETFCEDALDCRILRFGEATHAILAERDTIRDRALEAISGFFSAE